MITSPQQHKTFTFPAGEMHVQLLPPFLELGVDIEFNFTKMDDLFELLLFGNALKENGQWIGELVIPYFPCGRQDRVAVQGDAFSLRVICDLINSLEATIVRVIDPHSDVIPALLKNCRVVHQEDIFAPMINARNYGEAGNECVLVSPDGGALKKIYKLAALVECCAVVECSKLRNCKTGEITATSIHVPEHLYPENLTAIIVDDICDGGRTFVEIAKGLQTWHFKKIVLCVTHGLFTKGLGVFDGLIDEIYTRTGQVKEEKVNESV